MKCYLVTCIAGFIALDENFNIIDFEPFRGNNIKKILEYQEGEFLKEESNIIERLSKKASEIFVERYHPKYEDFGNVVVECPHKGGEYVRENLPEILKEIGKKYKKDVHDVLLKLTREKIKKSVKKDVTLVQAVNALQDVEETLNKLIERLREWYSIHFPEMDKIRNHEEYVRLITKFKKREKIMKKLKIKDTIGADFKGKDVNIIVDFAEKVEQLQNIRKKLRRYIDKKMKDIAPNLRDVAGSLLGAKLIAHVGSLERLASLPSSTVQVLGAEKALFRHLRRGDKPPKHGLIYQHPYIWRARYHIRGKIARTLASAISLAARKDLFTGKHDPNIKAELDRKVKKIMKKYSKSKRRRRKR
nr:hypothetical protein [Methanothermus fervidus]